MSIAGLDHVTATVDGAQPDLEFSVRVLGLRFVTGTINVDIPYGRRGVRIGTRGAGQVTVTSLSVPEGSLASWRAPIAI